MTTLFGTPRASSGRILLEGEDITALPPHRIARRGIALVPEGRRVFAKMSVYENLLLGATPLEGAHVEENLRRVFSLFPCSKRAAPSVPVPFPGANSRCWPSAGR